MVTYIENREGKLEKAGLAVQDGAVMGPSIWKYLGPVGTNRPFVPFPRQHWMLDQIKIPWPGVPEVGDPWPSVFAEVCGRRFGKTTMGEKVLWHAATAPEDFFGPPVVRMTADTEEHAKKIWRMFIWHLQNTPLKALLDTYTKDEERVVLKTGAEIMMLSAKLPSQLSGDGVTTWVIDEAQDLVQAAWDNLYPSTTERDGIIVMLGVAENDGPFKEASFKGDDPNIPEYAHHSYPTSENPYVPARRIEERSRLMTPWKFKQLYLAQWVDELGAIFRNVEGCLIKDASLRIKIDEEWGIAYTQKPVKGEIYYGGLDLARLSDWTVYTVFDKYANLIAWQRFNLVDWTLVKQRVLHTHKLYNDCLTGVDATGVGDAIVEDLIAQGMRCEEYAVNTNPRKRALIDKLAVRIGAGRMRYPNVPEMIRELKRMRAKRASEQSLVIVYEAPAGMHDDFPNAMALACHVMPDQPYEPEKKWDKMLGDPGPNEMAEDAFMQHGSWEQL